MFFKKEEKKITQKEEIIDLIKTVLIAGTVMFVIRFFIIQPFSVKGSSMEPNYYEHDYLMVDEISYRLKEPQRGDVVVFKYKSKTLNEYLIKRVIGLPGETVMVKDGKVSIKSKDGKVFQLDEKFLPAGRETVGNVEEYVNDGNYFVMGDNRPASYDSRYFGQISKDIITGKVLLRGFPFNRFGLIKTGEIDLNLISK